MGLTLPKEVIQDDVYKDRILKGTLN